MTSSLNNPNDCKSTLGLNPDKVTRLLQIGSELQEDKTVFDMDQQKSFYLKKWLEQTLPLDQSFTKTIPPFVARICERSGLLAGEPIRGLLNNPQTPITLIQKLKDYSKSLSETAKTESETDAALVLYYASIAHGILYHDAKITRFSYPNLIQSFISLTERKWIDADCQSLFSRVIEKCNQKDHESKLFKHNG